MTHGSMILDYTRCLVNDTWFNDTGLYQMFVWWDLVQWYWIIYQMVNDTWFNDTGLYTRCLFDETWFSDTGLYSIYLVNVTGVGTAENNMLRKFLSICSISIITLCLDKHFVILSWNCLKYKTGLLIRYFIGLLMVLHNINLFKAF